MVIHLRQQMETRLGEPRLSHTRIYLEITMFLNNKYTNWYISLIANAQNRQILFGTYTEKHHIIPRSMGGDDVAENLVKLTAKEHFVAHLLLVKMTDGVYHRKMSFALWKMTQNSSKQPKRHKTTAARYQSIKQMMAKNISEHNRGRTPTDTERLNHQLAMKRRSEMNNGPWNKGKKMPAEFGQEMSRRRTGSKSSPETRKKISESIKKWNENRKGTPSSMRGRKIPRYTSVIQNKITKEEWTTSYLAEWLQERNIKPYEIRRGLSDFVVIKRWVTKTGKLIFDHIE